MTLISLAIRNCVKVGILSEFLAPLALHAGKTLITRFIKGKKNRFCPHCKGKIYIRGRPKGKR